MSLGYSSAGQKLFAFSVAPVMLIPQHVTSQGYGVKLITPLTQTGLKDLLGFAYNLKALYVFLIPEGDTHTLILSIQREI